MTNEIEKQTKGQSRSLLIKMWQEDCSKNEEFSRQGWDNLVWLTKYAETFRLRHQYKNPFIKISDDEDKDKSYAEAAAKQTQVRRPQQTFPMVKTKTVIRSKEDGLHHLKDRNREWMKIHKVDKFKSNHGHKQYQDLVDIPDRKKKIRDSPPQETIKKTLIQTTGSWKQEMITLMKLLF